VTPLAGARTFFRAFEIHSGHTGTFMNSITRLIALPLLIAAVAMARPDVPVQQEESDIPPVPATPAPVTKMLYAKPFVLEQPFATEWREEQPLVHAGYVVVLEVDPNLVWPRALPQPILFAGDAVAERINHGHRSGRVIAIVPAPLDAEGNVTLDLSKTPIWFGSPGLPEQVTARRIAAERRLAEHLGNRITLADSVAPALLEGRGTEAIQAADRAALLVHIGLLIERYSPQEADLGRTLRGLPPVDDETIAP